ncbi:DNA polymerase Y family protein [Hyphomicrobium sp. GJ21]|uniref:Y-family DNA polymerase n=1 Tax=Hyphomicrobium sp. GJ21 TaxID=113574 RepID=UPI001FCCD77D|nr:DNA polymerase Y family protein [Hyphomicrobium sp. GJ21]
MSGNASRRRYLSLWMPFLSSDRWQRETGSGADLPRVFVAKVQGVSQLAAVDARALAAGLRTGMALADARARLPRLHAVAADPSADGAFISHLGDLALAFTPSVALDPPNGLALDITGCSHLFAGEAMLAARLQKTLCAAGVSIVRLAVAPTPDMARALTRFSPANPCFAEDDALVRALPVAALECAEDDATALRRAGLKTIAEIADRPSLLFTARFTSAFTAKLARILGEEDNRITPRDKRVRYRAEQRCAEPVASHDVIARLLAELVASVCAQLGERSVGGRIFTGIFMRADGVVRRIRVETSQPTRNPDAILRLYRDRLETLADPLDPGFGFDVICFEAIRVEPWIESQGTFNAQDDQKDKVAQLVDRLSTMFGRERVMRLHPLDSHVPERAQTMLPAALSAPSQEWGQGALQAQAGLRPLLIYTRPHPIDVKSDANDRPESVRWRRVTHRIAQAIGPERIAEEWWRPASDYGTRDYYRVESSEGRRFWIFCGASGDEKQRWFLHGVFS